MQWINLTDEQQLVDIIELSSSKPQVIFKHSTRCSISLMVKSRLEKNPPPSEADFYYLDLLQFRHVSNKSAELFNVHHESPQILMIKNGVCVYDESHNAISMEEISAQI